MGENENGDAGTTDAEAAAGMGLDDLREMMMALVPEAGAPVRWVDIHGNQYESPPYASARQQIRMLEALRAAFPEVRSSILAARESFSGGGINGVGALAGVVSDPAVLALLEQLFAVLHPGVVAEANKRHHGANTGMTAGDLFGAEEMLRAVLPFSIRPVLSVAEQLAPAAAPVLRAGRR